ncbi:hypothetical protein H0H93_006053 [Arthromyces matolae]|nr:hypothetical protein H0H93_006053 [Arthromyces matolae]
MSSDMVERTPKRKRIGEDRSPNESSDLRATPEKRISTSPAKPPISSHLHLAPIATPISLQQDVHSHDIPRPYDPSLNSEVPEDNGVLNSECVEPTNLTPTNLDSVMLGSSQRPTETSIITASPSVLPSHVSTSNFDASSQRDVSSQMPSKLPPEIVALCDSYVASTPVMCIASRAFLLHRWGIKVPKGCGYAYLGFFIFDGVAEQRLKTENAGTRKGKQGEELIVGKVEWGFMCRWVPSGEEVDVDPSRSPVDRPVRPWWSPFPAPEQSKSRDSLNYQAPILTPPDSNRSAHDSPSPTSTKFKTTPSYFSRHCDHPNYKLFQTNPHHLAFHHILPETLRGGEMGDIDGDLPNGWVCGGCGRINFRSMMRRCQCVSCGRQGKLSAGGVRAEEVQRIPEGDVYQKSGLDAVHGAARPKEKEEGVGYAINLWQLRDPQQSGPLSHPQNAFPKFVKLEAERSEWPDGMVRFEYFWFNVEETSTFPNILAGNDTGSRELRERRVSIAHLFTGNGPRLQSDATALLRDIQIWVPLERGMGVGLSSMVFPLCPSPSSPDDTT